MNEKLKNALSPEGTAQYVNAKGGMSSPNVADFTLLPWNAITEVAMVMTENCAEHGGKYPRDNWRKLTWRNHVNSLIQHYIGFLESKTEEEEREHITHLTCRALMMTEAFLYNEEKEEEEE